MEKSDDPAPLGRSDAQARVRELAGFYADLKATFLDQLAQIGTASGLPNKAHAAKLAELQATHVHLLKAEESFIEKFGQGRDDADIDYDAMRADIGRAIDRIRCTLRPDGVSGDPDGPADTGAASPVCVLGDAPSDAAGG